MTDRARRAFMVNNSDNISPLTQQISRILESGEVAALITLVQAPRSVGTKLLVERSGNAFGTFGDPDVDRLVKEYLPQFLTAQDRTRVMKVSDLSTGLESWHDATLMFERIEREPGIVICGAGHVGAALARIAALTGYRCKLIDDRDEFLSRASMPDERIQFLLATDWFSSVRQAVGDGRGIAVAVVTRGHNEDEQCLRAVMETDADYVGMIGSKRRTNIVLDRLRQDGIDEGRLQSVHAPVGLDIGAVTPEEVALAIMAEIIARRRGGTGASLSDSRRRERRL